MASLLELLGQTWPARMAQSAWSAAKLPGDVYAGRTDPLSEEGIGRAADLAGMVMGGTYATAPRGAMGAGAVKPIRAYHGSPHDFERFDLSKIGTGEGAQAYGHGLYFAENPAVAADYKRVLASKANLSGANRVDAEAMKYIHEQGGLEQAKAALDAEIKQWGANSTAGQHLQAVRDAVRPQNPGRMYEVNIHAAPEQFLDWDKALREQAANVRSVPGLVDAAKEEAYQRAIASTSKQRADQLWSMVKDPESATGQMAYQKFVRQQNIPYVGRSAAVSEQLKEAGIPGIKYLDQGSRTAGQGSSNYVLFRDDIIDIVKKYGLAGAAAMYGISQDEAKAMVDDKPKTRIGRQTYGE